MKFVKTKASMLQFDTRRRFTGLVIFKPSEDKVRKRGK